MQICSSATMWIPIGSGPQHPATLADIRCGALHAVRRPSALVLGLPWRLQQICYKNPTGSGNVFILIKEASKRKWGSPLVVRQTPGTMRRCFFGAGSFRSPIKMRHTVIIYRTVMLGSILSWFPIIELMNYLWN